ncbi:MAG: hypothetical protein K0Q49_1923 [Haloplasmataceae bacterium]|jgi:hypothetical protein|nr:hypothetical protein [Haloplasmataceae bacterium]
MSKNIYLKFIIRLCLVTSVFIGIYFLLYKVSSFDLKSYFFVLIMLIFILKLSFAQLNFKIFFTKNEKQYLAQHKAVNCKSLKMNFSNLDEFILIIKQKLKEEKFLIDKSDKFFNKLYERDIYFKKFQFSLDLFHYTTKECIYFDNRNYTNFSEVKNNIHLVLNQYKKLYPKLYQCIDTKHNVYINILYYFVIQEADSLKNDFKKNYDIVGNTIIIPILIDLNDCSVSYFSVHKYFEFYFSTYEARVYQWTYRKAYIINYNQTIKQILLDKSHK